jgi:hypothetical protein
MSLKKSGNDSLKGTDVSRGLSFLRFCGLRFPLKCEYVKDTVHFILREYFGRIGCVPGCGSGSETAISN